MDYSLWFVCLMGMGTVFFGLVCIIILTKLNNRIRFLIGPGKWKSYRLQRTKPHGIFSARCHNFNRHAAFKNLSVFKTMHFCGFRMNQRFPERMIFFFVHRAVEICSFPLAISGCLIYYGEIHRFFCNNRSGRIIEMESFSTAELLDVFSQLSFCQRSCGNDYQSFTGNLCQFLVYHFNQWML